MLASVFMAAGILFPGQHMSFSRFTALGLRHVRMGLFQSRVT
jgi:hypothetical protein